MFNLSCELKNFLGQFGFQESYLNDFARELNIINDNGPLSQTRAMPGEVLETPPAPAPKPKGKPGRPKGSKNKSTLEREAREASEPPKPKRAPGRPKGSKNK